MHSYTAIELRQRPVETEAKNKSEYSLLNDSKVAKNAGNAATLFGVCDAIVNCLSSRLKSVDQFIADQVPFYLRGLYYVIPLAAPLVPYVRHRCKNQTETHDPDAIELLHVLQDNDSEFDEFLNENPDEKNRILNILTSYLRYEKNQPFSIIVNLILLALRTLQGILIFLKGLNVISGDTNDRLSDWTTLISSISNIACLSALLLHNNFQKYHFTDKKLQHVKSHLLHETFFKIRAKAATTNIELLDPLLADNTENGKRGLV
jgi:hypothetical protein